MATFVNDLRLTELATGEGSGTWGETTNTNLELIAEAFSFGTEAITTNADTHTTTIADGSTDAGRSLFLKYTGTLDSACTITIGPNTVSKLWLIENATSGSQNIIIKQGSGATVTVPNGQTKAIYSDGAGSGGAMVDAFAHLNVVDLTVEDDLTITDDLTVSGAFTLTGNADLNGDLDVDGTTNLDVVDIDGAVDMASTLAVAGVVTANAGVVVDEMTIDADTITATDDFIIDAEGEIVLDANNTGQVHLKDNGTEYGRFFQDSNRLFIQSAVSDADILIRGNDGGSIITALTLDMSAAGAATFNDKVQADYFKATGSIPSETSANTGYLDFSSGNTRIVTKGADGSTLGGFQVLQQASDTSPAASALVIDTNSDVTLAGNLIIPEKITHVGDEDTFLQFNAADTFRIVAGDEERFRVATGEVVVNESSQDTDFRVEGNGNANMLFVDAGNDRVGIGTNSPEEQFSVQDGSGGIIFLGRTSGSTTGLLGRIEMGNTDVDSAMGGIDFTQDGATNNSRIGFFTQTSGSAAAERVRIDSDGLVGLGTTNPSRLLHLLAADSCLLQLQVGNTTGNCQILFGDSGSTTVGKVLYNHTGNIMSFEGGSQERMRISGAALLVGKTAANNGTAGVEASAAALNATVSGDTVSRLNRLSDDGEILRFQKDTATVGSIGSISSDLYIAEGNSGLRFDGENNQILPASTTASTDGTCNLGASSARFQDVHLSRAIGNGAAGLQFNDGSSDDLIPFSMTAADTVDSTISLGISSKRFKDLHLSTNIHQGATTPSSSAAGVLSEAVGRATYSRGNSVGGFGHLTFINGNGTVGSVTTSGSATAYNTSSDYRLKENVVAMSGATDRLKQLKPSRFNFIADADTTVDGFLAHEVQDVVPEAITGTKDAVDEDGNPDYQGIDQSKLVPLLVATIQELEARITQLESN